MQRGLREIEQPAWPVHGGSRSIGTRAEREGELQHGRIAAMRKYVLPLFAANSVAFAAVGVSYVLYSRLLSAQQFGIYSAALAVGNLATLVLDGGVKVSIIKHPTALKGDEESALLRVMLAFSVFLLVLLFSCRNLIAHYYPAAADQTDFVAAFAGVYLLTYPWIGLPTAQLERRLDYSRLAWIESVGLVLERGGPVFFLHFVPGQGLYAFVWSLVLGRLVRAGALAWFHRVRLGVCARESYRSVMQFVREGAWYQMGSGSSLIRDNLHVLVVGPMFGAAWVGYYAWGLQLCIIASQVFVQIAARISLPIAAQTSDITHRWQTVIRQIGLLIGVTAPILAAALVVAPAASHQIFQDKWRPALLLLPFLFARMLPGVATAPIGTLLLVERGARVYAIALWVWTSFELIAALAGAIWVGPVGLAVSDGVTAWVGLYLLVRGLNRSTARLLSSVFSAILTRPNVWGSLVLTLLYLLDLVFGREWLAQMNVTWVVGAAFALVVTAYAVDSDLRWALLGSKK